MRSGGTSPLGLRAIELTVWRCTGEINVPNLAQPYSAVCSGLTGLLFSGLITVLVSLASTSRLIMHLAIETSAYHYTPCRAGKV